MNNFLKRNWPPLAAVGVAGLLLVIGLAIGQVSSERDSTHDGAQPEQTPSEFGTIQPTENGAYQAERHPEQEKQAPPRFIIYPDDWVALFTCLLFFSTLGLWIETGRIRRDARRDMRTLERAYVWGGLSDKREVLGESQTTRIWLHALNAGKTPAIVKEVYLRILARSDFDKLGPEPIYTPNTDDEKSLVVVDHILTGGDPQILRPLVTNYRRWVLYGYIKYLDIWGDPHTSRYCMELHGELLAGDRPVVYGEPIDFPAWNAWD